jgi:hypothetical protein
VTGPLYLTLRARIDPWSVPLPEDPTDPVTLDHMERIRLDEHLIVSLALLEDLRIPASTSISLYGDIPDEPEESEHEDSDHEDEDNNESEGRVTAADLVHSHLALQVRTHAGLELRVLRFSYPPRGSSSVKLEWVRPDGTPAGSLTLATHLDLAELFSLVCTRVDVGAVAELEFAIEREHAWGYRAAGLPSAAECAAALADMPALKTLRLVHSDAGELFARALLDAGDAGPALHALTLLEQDTCCTCEGERRSESLPALAALLRTHKTDSAGLAALVFEGHFGAGDAGAAALSKHAEMWRGTAARVRVRETAADETCVRLTPSPARSAIRAGAAFRSCTTRACWPSTERKCPSRSARTPSECA